MPNYSVDQLTTVADCDAVLSIATKEQKDLEWKKLSIERQKEMYSENAVEITTELAAKEAELTALDAVIAGLPEGDLKEENIKKRKRTEYSIFLLTDRKANYGAVALLDKEYDLQQVLRQLEETAVFIAEVEARKAAVPQQ
ncbi:hypothetical protein A8C56_17225 [Niabella ginsenosidivorans]|uniref:Uncharacterized protein n=1 Tax=Niabella ginsenosidivorans TaxID=1176587 RepID=A0A1A9I473_9BACT|nr:hypothetical protein [Niabella ginsenosidivorans]ANH82477.1 hypothetical protein A8C56_17225 [Niabella ginsenosidivorans]